MGRRGFVGKVDSSLEEAVRREEDVGSAFPQWESGGGARGQLIPRACGGGKLPAQAGDGGEGVF